MERGDVFWRAEFRLVIQTVQLVQDVVHEDHRHVRDLQVGFVGVKRPELGRVVNGGGLPQIRETLQSHTHFMHSRAWTIRCRPARHPRRLQPYLPCASLLRLYRKRLKRQGEKKRKNGKTHLYLYYSLFFVVQLEVVTTGKCCSR